MGYPTRSFIGWNGPPEIVVEGISFAVPAGGALGLVGERGCGKSTLARALVRLGPRATGSIRVDGIEVNALSEPEFFPYRRRIQIVSQDPAHALNPRRTVAQILAEPIRVHGLRERRSERRERAAAALNLVRLSSDLLNRHPDSLSRPQQQRVGLARALTVEPDILVLDEPVGATDVCLQARLLDLLAELRPRLQLTLIFVSHDLAVVSQLCDRVVVLRRGRIVESGPIQECFRDPRTEYTRSLLAAVPRL